MFELILEYIKSYDNKISAVVRDLNSGERISYNSNIQFPSASIIKLPIMWEFYRRVNLGEIDPSTKFELKDELKVGNTVYDCGILRDMHQGIQLTYNDVLTLMIIISDDTATNILLNLLGMENITSTMKELGLNQTLVQRMMMDYEKVRIGLDNFTSAEDMDKLLSHILSKKYFTEEIHDKMLQVMANQRDNAAVPLFLPKSLMIAHKTGCIIEFGLEHDVAIIYNENKTPILALSLFTKNLDDNRRVMGRIAKMAYDEVIKKYK